MFESVNVSGNLVSVGDSKRYGAPKRLRRCCKAFLADLREWD
jgi:hypothetical protein